MDKIEIPLQKRKRYLSLTFYFFPTSLLLLLLILFIACNGLSIFYLQPSSFPQTRLKSEITVKEAKKPMSYFPELSSVMNAIKEEIPPGNRKTRRNLHLFLPPFNMSLSRRPNWLKKSRPMFKILQQSSQSKRFSARVKEFFRGSSSSSTSRCEYRFFMTWISSIESFGMRELITIESVFKSHPNACLLIISNSMDSTRGARLLRPFSVKGFRVAAISPDFADIFKNTMAEVWFDRLMKGKVDPGEVSIGQNLSNLLRLVILYKYGGIYIDTDIIVMKSLAGLRNAIGAQTVDVETGNWSRLNNAVLVFDKKHPLLQNFIEEFVHTFDGNKWGHNGPYLASRVVSRVLGRSSFNFSVLPPVAFYPVNWSRIGSLFHGPRSGGHSKWASHKLEQIRKESFTIHLWNRQSRRLKVEEGSVISQIMAGCCIFCNSSMYAL